MAYVTTWDINFNISPFDTGAIGDGYNNIQQTRAGVAERIGNEHSFNLSDTTNTNQGKHREGSARAFVNTEVPLDPTSVYAESTNYAKGRMFFNYSTGEFKIHNGTTWIDLLRGAFQAIFGAIQAASAVITGAVQAASADITGNASVGGNANISGTASISNGATINKGLTVNNGSTTNGGATINGGSTINNGQVVHGLQTLKDGLSVEDSAGRVCLSAVNGKIKFFNTSVITGSTTLGEVYTTILVNTTNAVTLTLPVGLPVGFEYKIQRIVASVNAITVARSGSETVEGGSTFTTHGPYAASTLNVSSVTIRKITSTDWRFMGGEVSGSNSNGLYRKLSDGTMECWTKLQTNVDTAYLFFDWVFPASFIQKPVVTVSLNAGGTGVWLLHGYNPADYGTFHQVFLKANQGSYADPNYLHCHAIDRWR